MENVKLHKYKLVDINKLIPYKNNTKIHTDEQINKLAKSIEKFGFIKPIIIDNEYNVLCGHGGLLASKKLELKEVPVLFIDNLSEEEKRAYIIADNKLAESEWDKELLKVELNDLQIKGFDLSFTGFGIEDIVVDDMEMPKVNERKRTCEKYNLSYFDKEKCEGDYDIPIIKKVKTKPKELMGFNYLLSDKSENKDKYIHFFLDDYQFERIWDNPYEYLDRISQYSGMLSPDFSLYSDMSISQQIYNVFRSRLIGQLAQKQGIKVIPTISWSDRRSYKFCFDGVEKGGTIAVSTIGVKNDDICKKKFFDGMKECIKRIQPSIIINYGGDIGFDYKDIKTLFFERNTSFSEK
ncbi:MAG: DUF4417 domain-containing protein [Lachnospiraceae bacterium]|nr:DUF4417 domain-containing protein [Lachnospiraceae bacterium]